LTRDEQPKNMKSQYRSVLIFKREGTDICPVRPMVNPALDVGVSASVVSANLMLQTYNINFLEFILPTSTFSVV